MRSIMVRQLKIGEGIPKICVPIVGKSEGEILNQAKQVKMLPIDLVEWRCDWFTYATCREHVLEVAKKLRSVMGDVPLLFTFRTLEEGGEKSVDLNDYISLNKSVILSGYFDLVDVQLLLGDPVLKKLAVYAHGHGVYVVASNHDFEKTPPKDILIQRLWKMQELGADIAKIAVMPESEADVHVLLAATKELSQREKSGPIVAMSMSEIGKVSRVEGELYGSAITFGSAGEASAPGQIPVRELATLLREVHEKKYAKKVEKISDLL